jgi:hypothetical protein
LSETSVWAAARLETVKLTEPALPPLDVAMATDSSDDVALVTAQFVVSFRASAAVSTAVSLPFSVVRASTSFWAAVCCCCSRTWGCFSTCINELMRLVVSRPETSPSTLDEPLMPPDLLK